MGVEVGARMTVLALEGGLLLHSPIDLPPEALTPLGSPRWVLAPNLLHHLHVGPWAEAGLEVWTASGLDAKRPDLPIAGVADAANHPFGDEIALYALTSLPLTQEVVLLHRPSRTLVTTDLVFHFTASAPWSTRAVMRLLGGHPGCRTTLVERLAMDRKAARVDIEHLLSWGFDRLVMAHGVVIETGGREALKQAFAWLLPDT